MIHLLACPKEHEYGVRFLSTKARDGALGVATMSPCPLSRTTLFTMRPSRSNSPKRAGVVEDETDQLLEESKELLDAKQNIEAKESSDSKPKARDTNKCAKCKSRLARKGA